MNAPGFCFCALCHAAASPETLLFHISLTYILYHILWLYFSR